MNPKTRSLVKEQFIDICNSTANAYGCTAKVEINEGYPVTINTSMEGDIAIEVAKKVVKTKDVKIILHHLWVLKILLICLKKNQELIYG